MTDHSSKFAEIITKNREKYKYYNADVTLRIDDEQGIKKNIHTKSKICKDAVNKFAAKIRLSYIDGARAYEPLIMPVFARAKLDALITGCSFLWVRKSGDKVVIENLPSTQCTGIITDNGMLRTATIYGDAEPWLSWYGGMSTMPVCVIEPSISLGYAPIVPVIYNPNVYKPFGSGIIDKAMRELYEEIAEAKYWQRNTIAEYGKNQKYLLGVSNSIDSPVGESGKNETGNILLVSKDEDGGNPSAGQYQPQSPKGITDAVKSIIENANAEAGKEDEHFAIEAAKDDFTRALRNLCVTITAMMEEEHFDHYDHTAITPVWKPSREIDFMKFAEGVQMMSQAGIGISRREIGHMLGMPPSSYYPVEGAE